MSVSENLLLGIVPATNSSLASDSVVLRPELRVEESNSVAGPPRADHSASFENSSLVAHVLGRS